MIWMILSQNPGEQKKQWYPFCHSWWMVMPPVDNDHVIGFDPSPTITKNHKNYTRNINFNSSWNFSNLFFDRHWVASRMVRHGIVMARPLRTQTLKAPGPAQPRPDLGSATAKDWGVNKARLLTSKIGAKPSRFGLLIDRCKGSLLALKVSSDSDCMKFLMSELTNFFQTWVVKHIILKWQVCYCVYHSIYSVWKNPVGQEKHLKNSSAIPPSCVLQVR